MTRLLVVVNLAAGSAEDEAVDPVLDVLRRGADVEVAATDNLDALAKAVAARDGRTLVAVGGDGSLHALMQTMHDAGALDPSDPVGLVPLGTGNDLARTVGIPLDAADAAAALLDGVGRPLDLAVDGEGNVLVNVAHLGVGAEAGRMAAGWKPALGAAAYPVGSVAAGVSSPGWAVTVEVDGAVVHAPDEPALMVAVANGRSIGGGSRVAPGAVPDDGLLDVVVSAAVGPVARGAFGLAMRDGSHVDRDDVTVHRGRSVLVTAASGKDLFAVNTDGEVSEDVAHRGWTLHPGAWSLLVPRGSADGA